MREIPHEKGREIYKEHSHSAACLRPHHGQQGDNARLDCPDHHSQLGRRRAQRRFEQVEDRNFSFFSFTVLQLCPYNNPVRPIYLTRWFLLLALLAGSLIPPVSAHAAIPDAAPLADGVTAYDLIVAMNTLRTSNGLPALIEDPIIDAVAQSTAATMAANEMSSHIGNVSGRLSSSGYGGGATVWGTENFAMGHSMSIDEIMLVWADPAHQIPAVNPAYCNVGAGIAKSASGFTYFVLQAAYTSNKACGDYKPPEGWEPSTEGTTNEGRVGGVSQIIVPVKIAEPDNEGNTYHIVQAGQSFWAIAIAYKVTIKDIEYYNNLSSSSQLQIGQKLFIPGPNTKGFATPTPVGWFEVSTPGPDGKIIHTVASYQTLSSISTAYKVDINKILALNGIQSDWPLQIGQKLVIYPGDITPSPTPRPLTPIEKLTPAADGKFYHTVRSGENLAYIAGLYEISLKDLLAWNSLNMDSILYPDQKLVLQVTPPATITPTPGPATATPLPSLTPLAPTASNTPRPTQTQVDPTATPKPAFTLGSNAPFGFVFIGMAIVGLFLIVFFSLKKRA